MGNSLNPAEYPMIPRTFRLAAGVTNEVLQNVNSNQILHVMSYNLLANRLATIDKFSHTSRSVLHFNFRGPRIMREIAVTEADVICMQEVDRFYDFYEPEFAKLGFKVVHFKRPKFFKSDGIAVAYRTSAIELITYEEVDMNDLQNIYGSYNYNRDN